VNGGTTCGLDLRYDLVSGTLVLAGPINIPAHIIDDDPRAFRRQRQRLGAANAASGASDNRHFAL
jgi:hypothetical protein